MENEEMDFNFDVAFGRPHPLHIPSVISEVMSYLNYDQLKTCRPICKDWDREAFKHLKGRSNIKFSSYYKVANYSRSFEMRKDFCTSYEFKRSIRLSTPSVLSFFSNYGENIQSLSLSQRNQLQGEMLSGLLFKNLPNLSRLTISSLLPRGDELGRFFQSQTQPPAQLPNLKYVSVDIFPLASTLEAEYIALVKAFLLGLFSVAPNLETIACPPTDERFQPLEFMFPVDPVHVSIFIEAELMDALDELSGLAYDSNIRTAIFQTMVSSETPQLQNLGEMDISLTLREDHVRGLRLKDFPLRKLDIVLSQNVSVVTMDNFLSSLGGTLESLSLRYLRRSPCAHNFSSAPFLRKLKVLKLNAFKGHVGFLHHFPELTSLTLIKLKKLSVAFYPMVNVASQLSDMRELKIFEVEDPTPWAFREQLIQYWAAIFPHLKVLRLDNICNTMLRTIYWSMGELEELDARYGVFSDSALTGILHEEYKSLLASGDYDVGNNFEIQPFSSLSCLKHLKKLVLNSKNMTDVGIIFGVGRCPSLKSLSLSSYAMTDKSLRRIMKDLRLEYLKTEFCFQLTKGAVKSVAKEYRGCQFSINEYKGPMSRTEMWKFLKRNRSFKLTVDRLQPQAQH